MKNNQSEAPATEKHRRWAFDHGNLIAIGILLLQVALITIFRQQMPSGEPQAVPTVPTTPEPIEVLFTNPNAPYAGDLRGGPDEVLVDVIDEAGETIDLAIYHLNLYSLRDALLRAHYRGVKVRIVTEDKYRMKPEIQAFEAAGIPVRDDERRHLMHHKFIVIDGNEVWTGSMNLTVNGAYHNDNNLIRIESEKIAEDYRREFEEMFLEDRFGALSRPDTPYPIVIVDGSPVEVYFSPDDGVAGRIVRILQDAERSIHLLAFTFTADPIAEALLERDAAGVEIHAVVEASQASGLGSDVDRLRKAGLDIRLDGNPARMHHKVIIIDEEIVLTGSYNFSRSAEEKNDENTIIIHNHNLAEQFLIEFMRIYENAVP